MNALSGCPAPARLQEYLLGRVTEATASSVEAHLSSCPDCRTLLPTIRAEDELVADFRAQAGRPTQKHALLDRLVGDLRGLLDVLPTGHEATPSADAEATPEPAGAVAECDEDVRCVLAPPQEADELGRLGEYRVLSVLGSGGMGVVFLAVDTRLRRRVALKAMRPALAAKDTAKQRFLREAQLTASLTHDHVVAVHQVGEQNGVPFLAMPLLQGESLDARLKRQGRLPLDDLLRIGRETAEGLAAAHEHGLIHRDIKPANLWLEALPAGRTRVKILDFGLARTGDGDARLTQEGMILGTPAYMAPEQARGEKVDARGDLFSLGCVLYKLCTGAAPFPGETPMAVLMALATTTPKPVRELNPDVPAGLSDLVMRLLEKAPAGRPASAAEVARTLEALEKPTALKEPQDAAAAAPAASATAARHRWAPLIAAAGLLAALIGVGAAALIHISTDQGDYVIQTDDPNFSFRVQGGAVTLEDRKNNKTYSLTVVKEDKEAGQYDVEVSDGGDLVFRTKKFTIKRGETAALTAWFEPKDAAANSTPNTGDAWVKQVEAVAAELKARNPGFDGKVTPTVENGVVVGLEFATDNVTDISPVRALAGLRQLGCRGPYAHFGPLTDLSPLKDMKLTSLSCPFSQVFDLSPLKDMELTYLDCGWTRVSDLSPLKGMKLTELACANTRVSDLSPLKDMPLKSLTCHSTPVSDLSPVKDMKLTSLNCGGTRVTDLSPLKDMPLTELDCSHLPVSDLSPLKGMRLTLLHCDSTPVSDLSPLKGMPLEDLNCDFIPKRDRETLGSIRTLVLINGKPAKEVLGQSVAPADEAWIKQVIALPAAEQVEAVAAKLKELNPGFDGTVNSQIIESAVTELSFSTDNVTDISPVKALTKLRLLNCRGSAGGRGRLSDLSPLKGMKLTCLNCPCNNVADLSPLEGMPLEELMVWNTPVARLEPLHKNTSLIWVDCNGTRVSDLSPLKGMPLKILGCRGTLVTDLSPLKGMPLNVLDCGATQVSDFAPLRGSKLITRLSGDFKLERDAEILRSIRTLQRINDKPAREFWKEAYPPVDDAWVQTTAALPAEEQVKAVAGKLKDLNPGFDGAVNPTIEDGKVVDVRFATDNVMDISALQALTALKRLICRGSGTAKGALWDLAPLKGMKLAQLDCSYNQVSDLSPLERMPLENLALRGNPVAKLEPLQKDMTLNSLDCTGTRVSDLSPLQGMRLQYLSCRNTTVTDLSPLRGMPLFNLDFKFTQASDLSVLQTLKLVAVSGDFKLERDGALLRSIPTLEQINGKPAEEFWKQANEKRP